MRRQGNEGGANVRTSTSETRFAGPSGVPVMFPANQHPAGVRSADQTRVERPSAREENVLGIPRDALFPPLAIQLLLAHNEFFRRLAVLVLRPAVFPPPLQLLARVGVGALLLERDRRGGATAAAALVLVGEAFGDADRLGLAADDGLTGEQDQVELLLLGRVGLQRGVRAIGGTRSVSPQSE